MGIIHHQRDKYTFISKVKTSHNIVGISDAIGVNNAVCRVDTISLGGYLLFRPIVISPTIS
jgi:hypothetical protein